MLFKIGDTVAVRDDICLYRKIDDVFITEAMRAELGKVGRVTCKTRGSKYGFYKLSGSKYWWPGPMLHKVDDDDKG